MTPRQIPTEQGRLAFGVALGSAAADAVGAIVDEDDQDDEAVLVAEQQKQQKEKTQPVLFTEDHMYTHSLSFFLSIHFFPSQADALALPCSLSFFLCFFFPDISCLKLNCLTSLN